MYSVIFSSLPATSNLFFFSGIRASNSCLMCDYALVIHFCIIIIISFKTFPVTCSELNVLICVYEKTFVTRFGTSFYCVICVIYANLPSKLSVLAIFIRTRSQCFILYYFMCLVCLYMCMYEQLLVLVIQPCCSSSLSYVHVFGLYLCFDERN